VGVLIGHEALHDRFRPDGTFNNRCMNNNLDMELEAVLFFISHYAFLAGIGILAYGIGRRLTQRMVFDSAAEQIAFCTTLGLGFLSYLILLIGTLGLLYRWLILATLGTIFLLCFSAWIELFRGISATYKSGNWQRWRPALLVLFAILIISPVLLLPLYPPTAFDSTMYHLPYAKIYTQESRIVFTPYLRYAVSPQTNEMLFTLAIRLYDGVSAQLIQFLMVGMLTIGLSAFGRRHFSQRAGIWGAAIFLSNPMVLWLGASAYIDVGLALFVSMAIYSIFNWMHSKETRWLILGALFLGFSAGSKYSALFFLILLGLLVLAIEVKNKKFLHAFLFIVIVAAIASPWYFRNWYYTGNPVFPFFGHIFGYEWWSPQDLYGQLNEMRSHGIGKSVQSFLLLPWNLAFKQPKFLMEAPYSPIYLFALPFLFFGLKRPKIRALIIIVFLYTLFWFNSAQVLRYLMPIMPILSLAVAASFKSFLERPFLNKVPWVKQGIVTLVVSILLFSPGWSYSIYKIERDDYPPCTEAEQEFYLTEKFPSFPAYKYLNQTRGRQYSIYALFDTNLAFYADGVFMGDWFGPARYEKIYKNFDNVKSIHRELRTLGADYFLVKRGGVPIEPPPEDFFSPSYFKLIMKGDHFLLFEVLQ